MRRFEDRQGHLWEVVIGRESWGALYAIFAPLGRPGVPVRQLPLRAETHERAWQELEAKTTTELQQLLDASKIKEE